MASTLAWSAGSTILVFLSNTASFFVLCGIGLLVRRAFGRAEPGGTDWFHAFWMGFAATIWFLLLWNFRFPVGTAAFVIVLVSGLIGLYSARPAVAGLLETVRSAPAALIWTMIAGGLWLANLATGPLLYWDSIQYHLRAIKWAHAYAAVPGLANLYGPLGYNNASFVYDALLMASPWGRLCHHVASSSLLFAMLAQCLVALFAFRDGDRRAAGRLLPVFFLPAVIALMRKDVAASFSTDVPLTLTLFAAACLVSDHFGGAGSDSGEAAYRVVAITALLAVAVSIKFGTAIFAVSTWLIVIGYHLRSVHTPHWRPVVVSASIGAAIGLTWMMRGIVLSGYPMFPMPIAAAPVEWRAPIEHARAEQAFIVHASRVTAAQLGRIPGIERFAVWFPRWLPRLVKEDAFAVLVPSVIAAVGLIVYIRVRAGILATGDISRQWLLVIPTVAGIVAWFSVAPEPRYALYVFWILAAVCCAQAERLAAAAGTRWVQPTLRAVSLLAAAGAAIVMPILERPEQKPLRAIAAGNLSLTRIGAASAPWTPSLSEFVTTSGIVLSVPINTGGRCGDAPLLCTPNPAPNLRMRDPQDLAQGFVVDGGWQMQIWPYDWLPRFLESWRALQ